MYKSEDARALAEQRCCPNCNSTTSRTFERTKDGKKVWMTDIQCIDGYTGVLCGACAPDYVRFRFIDACIPCPGGSQISSAIISLSATCILIFMITFIIIKKSKVLKPHAPEGLATMISAEVKILVSWLQIFSVLTKTFDAVPWGKSFTSYSQGSGAVVNLDLSLILSASSCGLSLPFLQGFAISAIFPIGIVIAIKMAQCISYCLTKDKEHRIAQVAKADKLMLLFMMMLFPSIANKSFTVFRCNEIPGLNFHVLDEDFSVQCWTNEKGNHLTYIIVAIVCIVVYAVGVPLLLFVELWRQHKHLHDPDSLQHELQHERLGALFTQYEETYWFWEVGNLIFKLAITGVLCVVAQGSPLQVILALLVCLVNAMFLLRWSPYESDLADTLSIVCASVLALTILGGYVAMANETKEMFTMEPRTMDIALVVLNISPFVVFLSNLVRLVIQQQKNKKNGQRHRQKSFFATKVLPKKELNLTSDVRSAEDIIEMKKMKQNADALRDVRLKYGAGSDEYLAALEASQKPINEYNEIPW